MVDINNILKRVKTNGYTYTNSNRNLNSQIPKCSNYKVYSNRREKEALIIDPKKFKKFWFNRYVYHILQYLLPFYYSFNLYISKKIILFFMKEKGGETDTEIL